jgi:hypothetical protein
MAHKGLFNNYLLGKVLIKLKVLRDDHVAT